MLLTLASLILGRLSGLVNLQGPELPTSPTGVLWRDCALAIELRLLCPRRGPCHARSHLWFWPPCLAAAGSTSAARCPILACRRVPAAIRSPARRRRATIHEPAPGQLPAAESILRCRHTDDAVPGSIRQPIYRHPRQPPTAKRSDDSHRVVQHTSVRRLEGLESPTSCRRWPRSCGTFTS